MLQVKFECRKVREQILPSSLNHYIHKDGCFVRGQGKGESFLLLDPSSHTRLTHKSRRTIAEDTENGLIA